MSRKSLIIPAAGSGKRMQREVAKPFINLQGQTILEHTLDCFLSLDGLKEVIVATSDAYRDQTKQILQATFAETNIKATCIEGGSERQESIFNALQALSDTELVLIHDAVRPFVTNEEIEQCCEHAGEIGAAVPGIPARDTIKKVDDRERVVNTPDRRSLRQIQTPQVFQSDLIKRAYAKAREEGYSATDDASLVERMGRPVRVVPGSQKNIKITYPQDLELARLILKQKQD